MNSWQTHHKKQRISLDFIASATILSTLSLLILPEFLLSWKTAFFLITPFCAITLLFPQFSRKIFLKQTALLVGIIAYIHSPALDLSQQADHVGNLPKKVTTDFLIDAIQVQQHYQTVIVRAKLAPELAEQRIYLQWKLPEHPTLGERWHGELTLRPISSRLNFNSFDRQQWYFSKGISAWASVKSAVRLERIFSPRAELLQQALKQTESLPQRGLLLALGFGERAWLPPDIWHIYQQTNTAHLIAISGLHIGLAMLFGFLLARGLQLFLPTPWISPSLPIFIGLCFAALYAYLAGFAIPTLRAIVALLLVYSLQWQRLFWDRWRLFARVVALLLLIDPLMILSASFWLSVGAVGCLLLWYQLFPLSLLHWRGKSLVQTRWHKWRYLIGLVHLQFGLFWLFMPIQLLFFNGLSLNGFWANLIAVPLYSFLLVPIILFAILTQTEISWHIADWLANHITQFIAYWQNAWLPVSINQTLIYSFIITLFFLCAMNWLYRTRAEQNSERLIAQFKTPPRAFHFEIKKPLSPRLKSAVNFCGISLLIYCATHFSLRQWQQQQEHWRLDALDIGQGLAHLIVKDGHAILYDTGASWNTGEEQGSMAKLEILPYLQREGIQLDQLILSHDDNDHSGGAPDILQAFPDIHFLSPSRKDYGQNNAKTHRTFCQAGHQWQWRGLTFYALAPQQMVERADNPHSCVLRVSDGRYSVLLTGDAEQLSESQFAPHLEKVDVLQIGHHGSKTSTSQSLLDRAQPQIALISAGRWNPWGFPHHSVISRLKQQKILIKNTALDGQIRVSFTEDEIKLHTVRDGFSPWYRRGFGLIHK